MKATKNLITYVILALLVIMIAVAVCFSLVAAMDMLTAHAETSGAIDSSGTVSSGTESGTISGTASDGKDIGGNVLKSLDIMWKGCLAIFIVIGLIILATVILNKSVLAVKKKRDNQDNNNNSEE